MVAEADWVDRLAAKRLLGRRRLFSKGWGSEGGEASLAQALVLAEPKAINFERTLITTGVRTRLYEATFDSPSLDLPDEARRARIRIRCPRRERKKVMCIMLPALGDGSWWFRDLVARPLVRHGISYTLLEAPYYGARRIPGGAAYGLGRVTDQFRFAAAVIEEAASLAKWFRDRGYTPLLCGYSMGGAMAGYTLSRLPWPAPAVIAGVGASAVSTVFEGLMADKVCWDALGDDTERMRRSFDRFSLGNLPPPCSPRKVHIVGCTRDSIATPSQVSALHNHWSGSQLSWMRTGHFAGAIRLRGTLHRRVRELVA